MASFNPTIFRAYDVRGVYRTDFDAGFAQQLGSRVAAYLKSGTVIVGRDGRASSDDLAHAVIDGAMHVGAAVIDIGLVSSPQFYWAIRELGATGGIMVTASHNPDDYNGFKVIGHDGEVLGGDRIRQIYDSHPQDHRPDGSVTQRDIIPGYALAVATMAKWHDTELQLSIDGPEAVRRALELIAPIAPDHGLAAKFDPDGDRITFYEHGQPIAADWILLLLAEHLKLQSVVSDLLFSRAVREHFSKSGVRYAIAQVGHLDMIKKMRQSDAELGAEVSGHYYWKSFGEMEAPELVLLEVMNIIGTTGKSLGELIAPYIKYAKSVPVSIPVKDRKAGMRLIEALKKKYTDGKVSELDGLTVEYPEFWFNLRLSNTEPVLRLTIEAESKEVLELQEAHLLLDLR